MSYLTIYSEVAKVRMVAFKEMGRLWTKLKISERVHALTDDVTNYPVPS